MFGGKSTGGDGAPGMGNDVDRTTDALDDRGDLICRNGRAAKRRVDKWLFSMRIPARRSAIC